jgi:hypothetical protein
LEVGGGVGEIKYRWVMWGGLRISKIGATSQRCYNAPFCLWFTNRWISTMITTDLDIPSSL